MTLLPATTSRPCATSPESFISSHWSRHSDRGCFPAPVGVSLGSMAELFDHIDELRRSPGKVAVATLVNTRGTTPRKEGAKMLVGEGGAVLGSVTIGGCVDAQVIEQTEDVLTTMKPRLLELNLGDEEAWEIGLTCGGTIEVFVEPLTPELYVKVREHAARGGHAAIVTRLDSGAKLLLLDDGTREGTLGEAFLDERFAAEAREAMAAGLS